MEIEIPQGLQVAEIEGSAQAWHVAQHDKRGASIDRLLKDNVQAKLLHRFLVDWIDQLRVLSPIPHLSIECLLGVFKGFEMCRIQDFYIAFGHALQATKDRLEERLDNLSR